MSETSLTSEYKNAILRLQVSGSSDSGTGYLIDTTNGYIITAFHVVQADQPGVSIDVSSPSSKLAGVKLTASLVKSLATVNSDGSLKGTDLALLKLDNPSLAKDIRPVDISLRYPSVDQVLYAMGYPQLNDEPNTIFSEQNVKFMATPTDGSIQVTQAIFGGNSGGPLMDPSGSVVGTCRQSVGIGAAVARYIPMSDGEALLDLIPLSDRIKDIDEQVRSGAISESDLRDTLVKSSTTPTNVELYAWARHILTDHDQYVAPSTKKLLQCEMKALMERGMEDLVIELSEFGDLRTVADANEAVAEREMTLGRPLAAQNHVLVAAQAYTAAKDSAGLYKAAILSTRIQLTVGAIDQAATQSSSVLAHIDSLAPKDRAMALANSADIDIAKGNGTAAIQKLNQASDISLSAGRVTTAASLLDASAGESLKVSKPGDAKASFTKAVLLYQTAEDKSGEAESLYKLGGVNAQLGDVAASKANLRNYLALEPDGNHATEVKELLAAPTISVPKLALIF